MSSHTPIAGVKDGLNGVLAQHYLGTFDIPVTNVNIIGRPIATSGVRIITESMKQAQSFLQQHAILAMVEASEVPAGGLSAAAAAKLQLRILDGAHRTHCALQLYGGEFIIPCRIYTDFNPLEEAVVASGKQGMCNKSLAAHRCCPPPPLPPPIEEFVRRVIMRGLRPMCGVTAAALSYKIYISDLYLHVPHQQCRHGTHSER